MSAVIHRIFALNESIKVDEVMISRIQSGEWSDIHGYRDESWYMKNMAATKAEKVKLIASLSPKMQRRLVMLILQEEMQ